MFSGVGGIVLVISRWNVSEHCVKYKHVFFYEQECLLFVTVLKLLKELNVITETSSSGRTNLGFDFRKPECTTEWVYDFSPLPQMNYFSFNTARSQGYLYNLLQISDSRGNIADTLIKIKQFCVEIPPPKSITCVTYLLHVCFSALLSTKSNWDPIKH